MSAHPAYASDTASAPALPWEVKFDYIESCNCLVSCPCPFTGSPTAGYCDLIMAFHVLEGREGDESLAGLNAVMVNDVPGNMRAGGYRTAVYIDEQGSTSQQEAMERIFTGKTGGVWAGFAALTVEWLGVRRAPIEISVKRRAVSIPEVLELSYEPLAGLGNRHPALVGTGQRIALGRRLNVGRSRISRFTDYGLNWDNSGGNVFWGRYAHASAG